MQPRILALNSVLLLGYAAAGTQTVTIPDTPAGHALRAWMEAFNSGDLGRVQAYIAKFEPAKTPDEKLAFHTQTGGFELLGIDRSEPLAIQFRVRELSSPTTAIGRLTIKDAGSGEVSGVSLRAIPPGLAAADMTMNVDAVARARVIDGATAKLNESYVFPEVASYFLAQNSFLQTPAQNSAAKART